MNSLSRTLARGVSILVFGAAYIGLSAQRATASDLQLSLNIPSSRLDVYESGVRTRSYPVSVGRRGFETPAGKYRIAQLIWNPWWHPPASKWARNEKPTPPGPDNPMGRVKINFANLLYIHGTLYEDDLGAPASHGCIRMSDRNLIELAHKIHSYRTPRVDPRLLIELESNRQLTRSFHIKPVQFQVTYKVVEIRDGELIIHPDVYRSARSDLHAEISRALKAEGIEVTPRLSERITPLAKRRIATRLAIKLDELIAGTTGD